MNLKNINHLVMKDIDEKLKEKFKEEFIKSIKEYSRNAIIVENTSVYTLVDDNTNTWECSVCREWWWLLEGTPKNNNMNYCPICGAKIVGEKIEAIEELIEEMDI
jgi:rubrerythrin